MGPIKNPRPSAAVVHLHGSHDIHDNHDGMIVSELQRQK